MSSPSERLEELAGQVARLPEQIAEIVAMRSERPEPPATDAGGFQGPPATPSEAAGPPPPVAAAAGAAEGEPALPTPADFQAPGGQPPRGPAYPDTLGLPPPAAPDYAAPEQGGRPRDEGQGEVVALLQRMLSTLQGAQQSRQTGRPAPGPTVISWDATQERQAEGFAGSSSPSVDVSNVAGAGGASSFRGFGSNVHSSRYWQPDSGGAPR